MSFFSEFRTRFDTLFKGGDKLRAEMKELRLKLQVVETNQRLVGGSALPSGLTVDAPLVWLLVKAPIAETGVFSAQRVAIESGGVDAGNPLIGKILELEDDALAYYVEPSPWCANLFYDALCLCAMAYTMPHPALPEYPDIAVYRAIAGEGSGIRARLTGAPDANHAYPWVQEGVHPDDALSDTVLGLAEAPYGLCKPLGALVYDPDLTPADRLEFPEDTLVTLRARQFSGDFVFDGFAESISEEC